MMNQQMKSITVKYSGYKLIGDDTMRDYDTNQPMTSTCIVPVTEELYERIDSDEEDDAAWDILETAVDALAACAGIYMKNINDLEV